MATVTEAVGVLQHTPIINNNTRPRIEDDIITFNDLPRSCCNGPGAAIAMIHLTKRVDVNAAATACILTTPGPNVFVMMHEGSVTSAC